MKREVLILVSGLCLFLLPAFAEEARFPVKHNHDIRSCRGELIFTAGGVEYITEHKKDARKWNYEDIQQLGLSDKRIAIVTYEDLRLRFGKDKIFNFELIEGTVPASLWNVLQARLAKPVVSALIPDLPPVKYALPVKHQHTLGGCQG